MSSPLSLHFCMVYALVSLGCTEIPACPKGTLALGSQCRPERPSGDAGPALDAGRKGVTDVDAQASDGDVEAFDASADAETDPVEPSLTEAGSNDSRRDASQDAGADASDARPCVPREEVCNGLDDNCNGDADEGVLTSFVLDQDGDGFGSGAPVRACRPPSSKHTPLAGDCDDACVSCFPGAIETQCDGKDNDCDQGVDIGLKQMFYRDADGDGFGITATTATACSAPAGYVSDKTDCRDDCASCNPGNASDATCDGKDDDCSGAADEDALYTTYYQDCDEDGYAGSTAGGISRCVAPVAAGGCDWISKKPASAASTDCNDANQDVKPGQTTFFATKINGAAASLDFDYDCDRNEERDPIADSCRGGACPDSGILCFYPDKPEPVCGEDYKLAWYHASQSGTCFFDSSGFGATIRTRGCQ